MDTPLQSGRAVRYACAVLADCRIGALPVDPFDLASRAGIMLLPLSQASAMIRAISGGERPGTFGFVVLLVYLIVFGAISVVFIYRKKNL